MEKSSFVLQALGILGPEEILKLSSVLKVKQAALKKAVGEEFIVGGDDSEAEEIKVNNFRPEGKILEFKRKHDLFTPSVKENSETDQNSEGEESRALSSEALLWQREASREAGGANQKLAAVAGYQKLTQMFVIKTKDLEGKEKIRFASTQGVLVNKKQA